MGREELVRLGGHLPTKRPRANVRSRGNRPRRGFSFPRTQGHAQRVVVVGLARSARPRRPAPTRLLSAPSAGAGFRASRLGPDAIHHGAVRGSGTPNEPSLGATSLVSILPDRRLMVAEAPCRRGSEAERARHRRGFSRCPENSGASEPESRRRGIAPQGWVCSPQTGLERSTRIRLKAARGRTTNVRTISSALARLLQFSRRERHSGKP